MSHIFATLYCFLHLKSRHEDMKLFSHSVIGFRGQGPDFARVFGLLALLFLIQKFQQIWPLRRYHFLLASEFDFSVCILGLCSEAESLTAELRSQSQCDLLLPTHFIAGPVSLFRTEHPNSTSFRVRCGWTCLSSSLHHPLLSVIWFILQNAFVSNI